MPEPEVYAKLVRKLHAADPADLPTQRLLLGAAETAGDNRAPLLVGLAADPHTHPDLLAILVGDRAPSVRAAAWRNRYWSREQVLAMATARPGEHHVVRLATLAHPGLPEEVYESVTTPLTRFGAARVLDAADHLPVGLVRRSLQLHLELRPAQIGAETQARIAAGLRSPGIAEETLTASAQAAARGLLSATTRGALDERFGAALVAATSPHVSDDVVATWVQTLRAAGLSLAQDPHGKLKFINLTLRELLLQVARRPQPSNELVQTLLGLVATVGDLSGTRSSTVVSEITRAIELSGMDPESRGRVLVEAAYTSDLLAQVWGRLDEVERRACAVTAATSVHCTGEIFDMVSAYLPVPAEAFAAQVVAAQAGAAQVGAPAAVQMHLPGGVPTSCLPDWLGRYPQHALTGLRRKRSWDLARAVARLDGCCAGFALLECVLEDVLAHPDAWCDGALVLLVGDGGIRQPSMAVLRKLPPAALMRAASRGKQPWPAALGVFADAVRPLAGSDPEAAVTLAACAATQFDDTATPTPMAAVAAAVADALTPARELA